MLGSQSLKAEINERFAGSVGTSLLPRPFLLVLKDAWIRTQVAAEIQKVPQGSTGKKSLLTGYVIVLQNVPEKCSPTKSVRRCRLLFSLLSETVFAHIFPVFERKRKWAPRPRECRFHVKKVFSSKRNGFRSHFPRFEQNERCTLHTNKTNQQFYCTTEKKPCNALFNALSPSKNLGPRPITRGPWHECTYMNLEGLTS